MDEMARLLGQQLFSFRAGAALLELSEWTLRQWAREARISTVKLGSRRLIPRAEIERLAREGLGPAREGRKQ